MKMILHGYEDVEAMIPAGYWEDLGRLLVPFLAAADETLFLDFLNATEGNPCTVDAAAPAAE